MSEQRVDVLAVLDHIADCDYIPVSTADLNATRAAVAELADSAKRMLRYIDSAHGDSFREEIAKCVIPGDRAIDRLRAALLRIGSAS